jgi:hypothetical protein
MSEMRELDGRELAEVEGGWGYNYGGYTYRIGEVNAYTGSSYYRYYDNSGIWTGSSYYSPYGSWSFSTPNWYQNMSAEGYSRIGETNAYGDSYTNYYDNSGDSSGYSYDYSYDW